MTSDDLLFVHYTGIKAAFADLELENLSGVRDKYLFDLALAKPQFSAGLEDAFPTLELKAAALTEGIVHLHPFVDANKRTGILAAVVMLQINGRTPIATPAALYDAAIQVEARAMTLEDLARWFADWNHVLPVTLEEWEGAPYLFDSSPWLVEEE